MKSRDFRFFRILVFISFLFLSVDTFSQSQTVKRKVTAKTHVTKKSSRPKSSAKATSAEMSEAERQSIINNLISNMVYVQGGTFNMGATPEQGTDAFDWEMPSHMVTVSSFSIGRYEITQKEWLAVMGEACPSYFKGSDLPVENVTRDDCLIFIGRLNFMTDKNFRLPTEAEWEYAARGGNQSRGYKYAGSNNINEVAWYAGNSGNTTHKVASLQPNELGLYDMNGNVFEWCQDDFSYYQSSPQTNPIITDPSSNHVYRGGNIFMNADLCRVSYRFDYDFGIYEDCIGFRLVCDDK